MSVVFFLKTCSVVGMCLSFEIIFLIFSLSFFKVFFTCEQHSQENVKHVKHVCVLSHFVDSRLRAYGVALATSPLLDQLIFQMFYILLILFISIIIIIFLLSFSFFNLIYIFLHFLQFFLFEQRSQENVRNVKEVFLPFVDDCGCIHIFHRFLASRRNFSYCQRLNFEVTMEVRSVFFGWLLRRKNVSSIVIYLDFFGRMIFGSIMLGQPGCERSWRRLLGVQDRYI